MGDEVTNLFRSASAIMKLPEPDDDELLEISDDEVVNLSSLRPKKTKKPKTIQKGKRVSKRKTSSSTISTETTQPAEATSQVAPKPTPDVVDLSDDDENRAPEIMKLVEQQLQENKSARDTLEKLRNTRQRLSNMQKTVVETSISRGSLEDSYVPESKEICLTICPNGAEFSCKNFTVKMYKTDPFSKLMQKLQEKKNFSGEHRFLIDGVEVGLHKTPADYYLGDRDELVISKKLKKAVPLKPIEIDDFSPPHSPAPEPSDESEPEAPSIFPSNPAPVAEEVIDDEEDFEIPVKKQKPAEEEAGVKVKVNYAGQKKGFSIKKNDPMQKLIEAVSKHFKATLKLKFDGTKVGENETAESLGLEDDDQLDAY